jgi:hypothetical protein
MVKLRYGREAGSYDEPSHVPYWKLGKIFGCSGSQVRLLIKARFAAAERKKLPLIE